MIKLFQKFVASRRRNGGRSPQRAKLLNGVSLLLTFLFAPFVPKRKVVNKCRCRKNIARHKNIYASYADDNINNNARSIAYVSFQFRNNNFGGLDLSEEHLALVNKWASYMDPYGSDIW